MISNETILLIEQDHQFAEFVAGTLLPNLGYKALIDNNGENAIDILYNFQPALLLLDSELPNGKGIELLRRIANQGKSLPTILLTHYGAEQLPIDYFRLGVQDCLVKPFTIEELRTSINSALTESRLRGETAALTKQLEEQISWRKTLTRIGQSITSTLDIDEVLRRIISAGVTATQAEQGFLALLDSKSNQLYMRAVKNVGDNVIKTFHSPVRDSLLGEVLQTGRPFRLRSDDDRRPLKVVTGYLVHSLLNVPILSKGDTVGVFSVQRRSVSRGFTERDEQLLTSLADYAAVAIENANLYTKARHEIAERIHAEELIKRKAMQAESMAHFAKRLNVKLDLETVVKAVSEEAIRALPTMDAALVLLYDAQTDQLNVAAIHGSENSQSTPHPKSVPFDIYQSLVRENSSPLVIPDVLNIPDVYDPKLVVNHKARTIATVGMYYGEDFVGVLTVFTYDRVSTLSQDELMLLEVLANQAASAINNARLYELSSLNGKRLQKLTKNLLEVQEAERRKLGSELHDELGQSLTSASLALDMLAHSVKTTESVNPEIYSNIIQIQEMINRLLDQVREISLDLRPSLLDDLGLLQALLDYFGRYTSQTHVKVDFKHQGLDGRFPPDIETAVFRIIQESLTNVARHALVDEAKVRVWKEENELCVQVRDEGVGFDLDNVQSSGLANGLIGMGERVSLCKGQIEIDSALGQGTRIAANFPLVGGDA